MNEVYSDFLKNSGLFNNEYISVSSRLEAILEHPLFDYSLFDEWDIMILWQMYQPMPDCLPKKETDKINTLVLDLDSTLVSICRDKIEDEIYDFEFHIGHKDFYGIFRPGLRYFLDTLKDLYEIVIFTAASLKYAENVMNFINPERDIPILHSKHVMDRTFMPYKPLCCLNRSPKNIIMIDDNKDCFRFHENNAIHIKAFEGYQSLDDRELEYLIPFLLKISNESDVRKFLQSKKSDYLIQSLSNLNLDSPLKKND